MLEGFDVVEDMMNRFWGTWIVGMTTVVVLGLAGCGSDQSDDRLDIAVIPKGIAHEFWLSVHAGALTAGKELDVNVIWQGPQAETMRDRQIQIIQDFIVKQVDGIVLAPLDQEALVPQVQAIALNNIPLVIFDSGVNSEDYISFVATDNYQGGVKAAHEMGRLLDGNGTCIIVRTDPASQSTNQREAGFEETLQSDYPGIEVIDSQYGYSDRNKSRSAAEDMLTNHPDVDAVFGPNESSTFGLLLAMRSLGHAGEKVFIGFDSSEELIKGLEAREINALVLQDPYRMGYEGVKTMVNHIEGNPVEKRVDTGVFLATPDTMNDPAVNRLLKPDLSIINE